LKNRDGEVTSHLSGLFYRSINFLEAGIRPVFVFDGEPPQLKRETIEERIVARKKAEEAWQVALAEGDVRKAWSKATRASRLTGLMISDSKRLLEFLGIPWIQAPSEGEAQASCLVINGTAYAAASQDFDSLLFGCPRLIRNLAVSGKRRLPKSNKFITIDPEEVLMDQVLRSLGITREQLVDIGIRGSRVSVRRKHLPLFENMAQSNPQNPLVGSKESNCLKNYGEYSFPQRYAMSQI
jgi:flap endonuclease-1